MTAAQRRFPVTAASIQRSMTCSSGTRPYTQKGSCVSPHWPRHLRQAKCRKAPRPMVSDGISSEDGGSKYLWHTGSNAGFRAFISRRLADRVTVIILTNKGNSKRQDINTAIQNILADKPYVLPKQSGAEKLYKIIHESGIRVALEQYPTLKRSGDFDLGESELNTLGYQLLYGDRRASDAIAVFKLNAMEHPVSSNAFDSLGEAYRVNGENNLAVISYRFAMLLDPSNGHAAGELKKLDLGRALWLALPAFGAIGVLLVAAILVKRRGKRQHIGQLPGA